MENKDRSEMTFMQWLFWMPMGFGMAWVCMNCIGSVWDFFDVMQDRSKYESDIYSYGMWLIISTVNAEFRNRSEAIKSAANIADQFETVNTWRELNYAGLE